MDRRGFLAMIGAACVAPFAVKKNVTGWTAPLKKGDIIKFSVKSVIGFNNKGKKLNSAIFYSHGGRFEETWVDDYYYWDLAYERGNLVSVSVEPKTRERKMVRIGSIELDGKEAQEKRIT